MVKTQIDTDTNEIYPDFGVENDTENYYKKFRTAACEFDAMYIIKAALEQSGATVEMSASEICDLMKTAMTEITVSGITGEMTWTADGEVNKEPKAVKIVDGAYTAM